jgi:hypothetical protein
MRKYALSSLRLVSYFLAYEIRIEIEKEDRDFL